MLKQLTAEQLHELHEKAPCGYIGTTLDGNLLHANETFATWVGRSKAELYNTNLRDLLTAASKLLYDTYYSSRIQLERAVNDIYLDLICRGETTLPVLLTSAVRNGEPGSPDVVLTTMFNVEERQRYEREILVAKRRADTMADVVRHTGTAVLTVSYEFELTSWNTAAEQLWAKQSSLLQRGTTVSALFPDDLGMELLQVLENNLSFDSEFQLGPDCLCRAQAFLLSDGVGLFLEDITEKKAQEAALEAAHERFNLVTRATTDGIWDLNLCTDDVYLSARLMGMLGLDPSDTVEKRRFWLDRIHPRDVERFHREMHPLLVGYQSRVEAEYRVRHENGSWLWLHSRSLSISNVSGEPTRIVGSVRDITKGKLQDSLTGLHTRISLLESLERRLGIEERNGCACAILFVDLDGFKRINDGLGHRSGDHVLQHVGKRLDSILSFSSLSIAARLGGDEFVIVVDEAPTPTFALDLARKVHACVQQPLLVEGRPLNLSASIGVALSTDQRVSAEELIRNADVAMYRAKASGRAQTVLFTESMRQEVHDRMELESDLRLAVKRDELTLYYQPKVVLDTREIIGFEALGRWFHPKRGMVPPDVFIDIAEESSLICEIGLWTIREALSQLARWRRDGVAGPDMTMAINLSPKQFGDTRLIETLKQELEANDLPGASIELEVTEGVLIGDAEEALRMLEQLKQTGVGLELDDFGKGYSSLSYLHRYPFSSLKVDRSFTNRLGSDEGSLAITKSVIALGRALGLEVIAEGIETERQARFLVEMGCSYAQGYLFYKPMPPAELERTLKSPRPILQSVS